LVGCPDADTLAALVADALGETERAAIAVHAATCDGCHALLAGLLETRADSDGPRGTSMLRDGTRVGRYVLGERLGAGGMGVVYAAVDSELQRRVAVKLLRPDGGGELGTQGRERLMREARVLASLSHPNVVTVFDVGTHDDNVFLAMELVEGGNLSAWLRAGTRSFTEIVDRLIDAGRGLAAAHAAGVVHRDVKPDNILVGRDGRARVTDFGLARFDRAPPELVSDPASPPSSQELTRAGTRMGTPMYMAPEQLASGETGPRADQWSFCAMIYEAVAGVRPFRIEEPEARAAAIAAGRLVAPIRRVPGWMLRIVTRGLRAAPSERWPGIEDLVAALERGRRRPARIVRTAALAGLVLAALGGVAIAKHSNHAAAPYPTMGGERLRLVDERPGCNCPMSTCPCASVCRASEFAVSAPIAGISEPGRQEALLGASGDGEEILFLAGTHCSIDRLWLAHRTGDRYESIDLTGQLDLHRVALFEGCCTLAADGHSMVLARPDHRGFV
jgi:eukaryotic-like serine/threonine-protein kinase